MGKYAQSSKTCSHPTEACGEATRCTQSGALVAALRSNLAELEQRLRGEPRLKEVPGFQHRVRQDLEWCGNSKDPTWAFVQECLVLLLALTRHLTHLLESFRSERDPSQPCTPEAAPPLPPDVLSVAQQKTVSAALQFVVTLGLCPYLSPGVGIALECRSTFGAAVAAAVDRNVAPPPDRRLLTTTFAMLEISEASSVATLVLTRHLGDILAGLCQLGYCPEHPEEGRAEHSKVVSMEERTECRKALQSLLGKVYQPIVIKELLILQGGPKQARGPPAGVAPPRTPLAHAPPWLRRLCGQLLSERLMQPNGVQAVVRAILEGAGGSAGVQAAASDWKKCDAVARILAVCPQQSLSVESYYSQVCPQVLDLLHFRDKLTALQFQRVATCAAFTMVQKQPELGRRYLLAPLFAPLVRCRDSAEGQDPSSVQEWELTRCVEDMYKVCVVGNSLCPALLTSLEDILPVLFSLYCFTKRNVSHLRTPCQEILLWYLSHAESPEALRSLKRLCILSGPTGGVSPGFEFLPGSEGGARLAPKAVCSDEDDALYEKLAAEQWRVECLVQLLAELKDSDLPGGFFLELLKELTSWAVEEEDEEKVEQEGTGSSASTLLQLEERLWGRVAGQGQRVAFLQVLASMCERLSHTHLLRRPVQVVEFVEAMLQRACVGLAHGSGGTVETQSLSMGMGLVATMLTGAMELSAEDYSCMSHLLQPLDQISKQHPEPVIQELASDLRRATLATHGAYCPDTVTQAAHRWKPTKSSHSVPEAHSKDPHQTVHNVPTKHSQTAAMERTPTTQPSFGPPTDHTNSRTPAPEVQTPGPRACGSSTGEPHDALPSKAFTECLLEACDPDVPTKAMALRVLTGMVRQRDAETLRFQDKVLTLFLDNLEHDDSFVYLSAIEGLAVLADTFPERILKRLLEEYRDSPTEGATQKARSLETRLKMGEVLMRASRAMGDLAPHCGHPLIGVFLRGTRDEDSSIRTSSLSNLGELCQRLQFSLGPLVQELSSCLTALIKTEKEKEVRRAAVHVIALLLRGLSDRTTQVLGDVLLDLYRTLKWVVRSDSDDVAVLHAQLALEELDDVMRRFIFPAQKLEKKIVVLP
ncbi:hypothetical protein Z043_113713 [Scleropages formosus]|uniref:Transport and Golgi organization protein 6-like n=1 Tax=Scleropages formosus TaxID=113540 RepID=A0A0P7U0S6_SCLFO|nr:hypothetical protein Z043_113713 [Scleropages formosus]